MAIKGQHEGPCGDGNLLCLGHTDVNILLLILCCSFQAGTTEGNWIKGIGASLYYFL